MVWNEKRGQDFYSVVHLAGEDCLGFSRSIDVCRNVVRKDMALASIWCATNCLSRGGCTFIYA